MHDSLESLLARGQAGTTSPDLPALAVAILRFRRVGRAPKGQPLAGVYDEIYNRARAWLLDTLETVIAAYNPSRVTPEAWARELSASATKSILDDGQLKRLALEAQGHPPLSLLRQHALSQLVEAIQLSGRLARPHRHKFSPKLYALLYDEAVHRTLAYVCRKIENYDPDRGEAKKFMNWVNFRLDRTILDCRREYDRQDTEELPHLNDLERIPMPPQTATLADLVRECLEADTDNLFKQAHIRNHPQATFQAIALARIAERSWEEISTQFAIKVPTLSSFYQRCCQKFAPQLQAYVGH